MADLQIFYFKYSSFGGLMGRRAAGKQKPPAFYARAFDFIPGGDLLSHI